jgi:hypothetical protein
VTREEEEEEAQAPILVDKVVPEALVDVQILLTCTWLKVL